ncbi:MAG: ROK family protein [Fimbriimonadaceae bacterium]
MRVAGVDIGGTKTALGLFEGSRLLERSTIETGPYGATLDRIAEWIALRSPEAVGVGCRGPLDEETGYLECVTPEDWHRRPLRQDLESRLPLPMTLVNDADAALMGEVGEHERDPVLLLTLGTGVGGALWTGSHRYRGAFGEHPEIGHVLVFEDGPACACGLRGCLEHVLCRGGLAYQAEQAGFGPEIARFLSSDHPGAERVRQGVWRALAIFAYAYRPGRVVFGGGVTDDFGHLLVPFGQVGRERFPFLVRPLQVERARLGNWAGVHGAARIAREAFGEGRP